VSEQLPGELAEVAALVALKWPKANSREMWIAGHSWADHMQNKFKTLAEHPQPAIARIREHNQAGSIDAFFDFWNTYPSTHCGGAAKASAGLGAALMSAAMVIKAYKTFTITELTLLKDYLDRFHWPAAFGGPDAATVHRENAKAIKESKARLDRQVSKAQQQIQTAHGVLDSAGNTFTQICKQTVANRPKL
jgi:hypothetical protein